MNKNGTNHIGWTALHEACFFNRFEATVILLKAGCDPTIRTKTSRALPYHLTTSSDIKKFITELQIPGAAPSDNDKIDMLVVLEELGSFKTQTKEFEIIDLTANSDEKYLNESKDSDFDNIDTVTSIKFSHHHDDDAKSESKLSFHLPNLLSRNTNKSSAVLNGSQTKVNNKSKGSHIHVSDQRADYPKEFTCDLSHKLMTEPVTSIYGNKFEKGEILKWIDLHGKICPITGAPLCITDLTELTSLNKDIQAHVKDKSSPTNCDSSQKTMIHPENKKETYDDIYEFS